MPNWSDQCLLEMSQVFNLTVSITDNVGKKMTKE